MAEVVVPVGGRELRGALVLALWSNVMGPRVEVAWLCSDADAYERDVLTGLAKRTFDSAAMEDAAPRVAAPPSMTASMLSQSSGAAGRTGAGATAASRTSSASLASLAGSSAGGGGGGGGGQGGGSAEASGGRDRPGESDWLRAVDFRFFALEELGAWSVARERCVCLLTSPCGLGFVMLTMTFPVLLPATSSSRAAENTVFTLSHILPFDLFDSFMTHLAYFEGALRFVAVHMQIFRGHTRSLQSFVSACETIPHDYLRNVSTIMSPSQLPPTDLNITQATLLKRHVSRRFLSMAITALFLSDYMLVIGANQDDVRNWLYVLALFLTKDDLLRSRWVEAVADTPDEIVGMYGTMEPGLALQGVVREASQRIDDATILRFPGPVGIVDLNDNTVRVTSRHHEYHTVRSVTFFDHVMASVRQHKRPFPWQAPIPLFVAAEPAPIISGFLEELFAIQPEYLRQERIEQFKRFMRWRAVSFVVTAESFVSSVKPYELVSALTTACGFQRADLYVMLSMAERVRPGITRLVLGDIVDDSVPAEDMIMFF
jgi:hypothetical protein